MKMAHTETLISPVERAISPALSAAIDKMIATLTEEWRPLKWPVGLRFPSDLEELYETQTRESRVRELQFTLSAAAAFQFVTIIADPVFIPDVGWVGLWLRALVAVFFMCSVVSFRQLSPLRRELLVFADSVGFVAAFTTLTWLSHAPLAAYEVLPISLGIIYVNTTTPIRFRFAWLFNLVSLAVLSLALLINLRIGRGLAGVLIFLAAMGSLYSVIANYRMERGSRLAYLLISKEALRLFDLVRDRDHLEILSKTDNLTGLANRGHFDRRIAELFEYPTGGDTPICLLLLDVDFFKGFNDRYGHPAGDACLRQIAEVMKSVMRGKRDFAFRYGGEEFGILLLDVTEDDARQIANRVRQAVEAATIFHENRADDLAVVTVSIGVSYALQEPILQRRDTPENLLSRADLALYQAKRAGRNRVEVSRPDGSL